MILREPLDHDLIVDKDFNIYVVFGSKHPYGLVYAYLKYRSCFGCGDWGLWSFRGVPLKRVVNMYRVDSVLNTSSIYQGMVYDPVYGSYIPFLKHSQILIHMLPEDRAREIVKKPSDDLEYVVSEAIYDLRRCSGIPIDSIGVGGSILGGFHNVDFSDIDLIVYGCRNAVRVYESIECFSNPLSGRDLDRWVSNQANLHGVPLNIARMMYSPYRRSLYRGRALTFMFPEDYSRYGSWLIENIGSCCLAYIDIPEHECGALQYPGFVTVDGWIIPSAGCRFRGVDVGCLIIYEGAFSPIIFRGGPLIVKGLLVRVRPHNLYCIVIGSRECGSYINLG